MSNIITTDIATIVDSDKITLVNNPSFIQFIGNQAEGDKLDTLVIKFNGLMQANNDYENLYSVSFSYSENGVLKQFRYIQTVDDEYAGQYNNVFYQGNTVVDTVRNLQQKLLTNNFLTDNFIITSNNDLLSIKPKVSDATKAYTVSYLTGYATTTDTHIEISGNVTYITPSVVSSGTTVIDNTIPTFTLTVNSFTSTAALPAAALLTFIETNSRTKYEIQGTTDKSLIAGNKNYFYLNSNPVITCNNLVQALLTVPFFKNNFILTVDGDEFSLVGKRNNPNFSFNVTFNSSFCSINNAQYVINNSNVLYNSQIELDIYKNNEFVTTISKSYIDGTVWFDVNNILNRTMKSYPNCLFLPNTIGDSGTTMKYNYNSKYIKYYDTQFINFSENKYVVDGFVRTLEPNDMNSYVYSVDEDVECNILTNKLDRIYNVGEDISANIIVEPSDNVANSKLGLLIKYYENNRLVNENIIDNDIYLGKFYGTTATMHQTSTASNAAKDVVINDKTNGYWFIQNSPTNYNQIIITSNAPNGTFNINDIYVRTASALPQGAGRLIYPITEITTRWGTKIVSVEGTNSLCSKLVVEFTGAGNIGGFKLMDVGFLDEIEGGRDTYEVDMNLLNSIYVTSDNILVTDRTQFFDVVWVRIPSESPDDLYEISSYIRYTILRECNDSYGFMFLNKLGGWDIYYFNSDFSTEFKTEATTSFKTLQPNYKVSDSYEKVEFKETEETFVIKTMVNKETAEWLKELSTSKYVYSLFDNNRYIIVQDFDLSISDKDLFEVTMKFTYSDTYNTILK